MTGTGTAWRRERVRRNAFAGRARPANVHARTLIDARRITAAAVTTEARSAAAHRRKWTLARAVAPALAAGRDDLARGYMDAARVAFRDEKANRR